MISDWKNVPLEVAVGDEGTVYGGPFGSDLVQSDYVLSGVPVIRVSNQNGTRISGDFVFVSHEKAKKLSANKAVPGDIIVVQRGSTFGKTSRIERDSVYDEYIICQSQMAVRVDKKIACEEFIFQFLRSPRFDRYAKTEVIQTGQPHLNLEILRRTRINLPPLPEQRKIAEILRTWDEAIEKLEALRAAKQRRLAAVARELFDPCHPSFADRPASWREYHLGDLFSERDQAGSDTDRLLSITMAEGVIDRDEVGRRDTSTEDKSRYKLILPGDIGYNTMRMWQGVSGLSSLRGIVSPAYTVVVPDKRRILTRYAAHLFKSRRMVFDFERYSQGMTSDTWNLKFPAFSMIKVFLPPIEQQLREATALDAMHAEIALLGRQIEALTRQKRGLMQKLLTGVWRVLSHAPCRLREDKC